MPANREGLDPAEHVRTGRYLPRDLNLLWYFRHSLAQPGRMRAQVTADAEPVPFASRLNTSGTGSKMTMHGWKQL
jgi:hypothetical protein